MPCELHANWAGATASRIAPSPTNAEAPNVARSLLPSTLNVSVEAGIDGQRVDGDERGLEARWRARGASLNTGVAAREDLRRAAAAAGGSSAAPGLSAWTIVAASASTGWALVSTVVPTDSVRGQLVDGLAEAASC